MLYPNKDRIAYIRQDNRRYEAKFERFPQRHLRKILCGIKFENINNGIIILIPKYDKYNCLISKKITKKITNICQQEQIKYIALENKLDFLKKFITEKNIIDGKFIMKLLVDKILEYILNIKSENMNLENIYVFVNTYNKINIKIIEKFVAKFKTVNIITENLKYYKRLENKMYKDGILITVSNNKRKSAKNAKYIVNIDFESNAFNEFCINQKAIIINLTKEKIIFKKSYNGIIVNDFNLKMNTDNECFYKEFYGNIDNKILLESWIINMENFFEKLDKKNEEYSSEICDLLGIRGKLQKCEFLV